MSLDIVTAHGSGSAKAASVQLTICAGGVAIEFFLLADEAEAIVLALNEAIKEAKQAHGSKHRAFCKRNGLAVSGKKKR